MTKQRMAAGFYVLAIGLAGTWSYVHAGQGDMAPVRQSAVDAAALSGHDDAEQFRDDPWVGADALDPPLGDPWRSPQQVDRGPRAGQGLVFKSRLTPHWFDQNKRFWYRNDLAGGTREFIVVDAERGSRQPAFDHQKLAAALSKAAGTAGYKADRLPFETIEFDAGPARFGSRWASCRGNATSQRTNARKPMRKPRADRPRPVMSRPPRIAGHAAGAMAAGKTLADQGRLGPLNRRTVGSRGQGPQRGNPPRRQNRGFAPFQRRQRGARVRPVVMGS